MKQNKLIFALAAACGIVAFSSNLSAQTCTSPLAYSAPPAAPQVSGDTCAATNSIGTYCGLVNDPQNEIVYEMNLASPRTADTLTVTPSGAFNVVLAVFTAPCATASNCSGAGPSDTGGNGAAESFDISGLADGQYFIAIAGSPDAGVGGGNDCGTFTLTANGTLPVKLQGFSVN